MAAKRQGLAWDDGTAEVAAGNFQPQAVPALWGNPFGAGSGAVIDAVRFAIHDDGSIAVGDPVSVFLWDDPDDDGLPDDAVLLRSGAGTVQALSSALDDEPELFNEVAVEPIAISGGFFAGVLTTTARYPVMADEVPGPMNRSFGILTFDDPQAIQLAPAIFFGVVLVRAREMDCDANGVPDGCDCPADVDGDGSAGITDLLAVLAAWGSTPPSGGPPDLDHDGVVGDGDVQALLKGWGECR